MITIVDLIRRYENQAKFADPEVASHFRVFAAELRKVRPTYPLAERSAARQRLWDPDEKLGLLFLSNEMGGECGEAQNAVKKLERERLGLVGSRITTRAVGHELADVVICASNVAWKIGVDLFGEAIPEKFDITSEKYGLPVRWLP